MKMTVVGAFDDMDPCPYCRAARALIAVGDRVDRSYHWLRWAVTTTHIYTCLECGVVVEFIEVRGRRVQV